MVPSSIFSRVAGVVAAGILTVGVSLAATPSAIAQSATPTAVPAGSTQAKTKPHKPASGDQPAKEPKGAKEKVKGKGAHDVGEHVLGVVAAQTGLTAKQVAAQLRAGRSLNQIAQDKGVSEDQLKAAITADVKQRLDADVAAGTVRADQEEKLLAAATKDLDKLLRHQANDATQAAKEEARAAKRPPKKPADRPAGKRAKARGDTPKKPAS
jgi:hypothetical protein